jgi:hypothetical protein
VEHLALPDLYYYWTVQHRTTCYPHITWSRNKSRPLLSPQSCSPTQLNFGRDGTRGSGSSRTVFASYSTGTALLLSRLVRHSSQAISNSEGNISK